MSHPELGVFLMHPGYEAQANGQQLDGAECERGEHERVSRRAE